MVFGSCIVVVSVASVMKVFDGRMEELCCCIFQLIEGWFPLETMVKTGEIDDGQTRSEYG